jgi:hypothetical protein
MNIEDLTCVVGTGKEEGTGKIWKPTVLEQYEYQGFLITITNHWVSCTVGFMNPKELIGMAVEFKYAHLVNVKNYDSYTDDVDEILSLNGFEVTYDEQGNTYVNGEPDIVCIVAEPEELPKFGFDNESASSVLEFLVSTINQHKGIEREWDKNGFIVLKQIQKYKPPIKSSSKQRGYMHTAWSNLVKHRDLQKCTNCGNTHDLHAHHVKSFKESPELRYDVNNGVTLCGRCHRAHHKLNGR